MVTAKGDRQNNSRNKLTVYNVVHAVHVMLQRMCLDTDYDE